MVAMSKNGLSALHVTVPASGRTLTSTIGMFDFVCYILYLFTFRYLYISFVFKTFTNLLYSSNFIQK